MTGDLCYISAVEALALFKARKLSPVELLKAQIERFERVNPRITAIVMDYFEEALVKARRSEVAYMHGSPRPLEGLTIAVKDEQNIAGTRMTNGSLLLKDNISTYTDPLCERLLDAGAIIHARTATPEFSGSYVTWSKLWGVTRNPWNREYTVGGSSGGSGAALAAGMTTLATGSDIGGSVRQPASQNGVVGYKPPRGRVPKYPPWNLIHYYSDGPMARNVADTILMENIIAGQHRRDMNSLKRTSKLPSSYASVAGMRIACCLSLGGKAIDTDIRANTLATAAKFRENGATVEEVEVDWDESKASTAAMTYVAYVLGGFVDLRFGDNPDFAEMATSYIRSFVQMSKTISRRDYLSALSYESVMYDCIRKIFDEYHLLMCPTVSIASVRADFDTSKDELVVDGRPVSVAWGPYMTHYFNTLSRLPTLSVPSGFDRNNVPTGIQIVGPAYEEEPVFRAAMTLERTMPPLFANGICPSC